MIEKLSKYKDLEIKVSKMSLKTETESVVIAALGLLKTDLGKYVEKITRNIIIEELPKMSFLGTAHILQKVLSTN